MDGIKNQLRVRVPASRDAVPLLRHKVVEAVTDAGDEERLRMGVALAASELVSDVVRHASPQAGGEVEVEAWRTDGGITLIVRDGEPVRPVGDPAPGWGLAIVQQVATSLEVRRSGAVEFEARFDAL